MKTDKEKTKVIFRKFKKGDDIIALFPEIEYNHDKKLCMSYMHVGQHDGAAYALIYNTIPAKPEEYADLFAELNSLGYNLAVQQKITKRWFEVK
jgi:hypothetical protein